MSANQLSNPATNWLKQLTRRQVVKKVNSPINGPIEVVKVLNQPQLIIGGMLQSGGLVQKIWKKAIRKIKDESPKISEVLIIGLGGGNCAREISKHFPQARMTGIEIDKNVVEISKKYFDLESIKNLTVHIEDGNEWIAEKALSKKPQSYDLIIIDAYLGKKIPLIFKTRKFIKNLEKILNPEGTIIFNHLFSQQHKQEAKRFIKKLETVFPSIKLQRTTCNLLIFVAPTHKLRLK